MIEMLPKTVSEELVENNDSICHWYCGNVNPNKDGKTLSYCGMDITHMRDISEDEECMNCTMCVYESNLGGVCPKCGCWEC